MTKYLFIFFGLLYFLFPFDIIPDFAGFFGRIDDLLVVVFLVVRYWRLIKKAAQDVEELLKKERAKREQTKAPAVPRDPYEVLQITRDATPEEIHKQYRSLLALYHPDKVTHLGKELQALAHQMTLEITQAYESLPK